MVRMSQRSTPRPIPMVRPVSTSRSAIRGAWFPGVWPLPRPFRSEK